MSYEGEYDVLLVILAVLVAILGSYASLDIVNRMKRNVKQKSVSMKGLIIGSITMGLGIWTMHFIGMVGYDIHIKVAFGVYLTIFSLIFSIIVSFLSFYTMLHTKGKKLINLLAASLVMGTAIAGVYFLGIMAMHMDAGIHYNILIVSLAVIIGIMTSVGSFIFPQYIKGGKIVSAVILGIGISSMHYTAIKGMTLTSNFQMNHHHIISFEQLPFQFNRYEMALYLAIFSIFIIVVIIILAYLDKFNAERHQKITEQHYQSLVEHSPFLVFSINIEGSITDVNSKGLDMLKYQQNELIGSSLFKLLSIEDEQKIKEAMKNCQRGNPSDIKASIKTIEESLIPMSLTFIPIIIDKKSVGMFMIGKDIMDLIEYKERIRKAQRDLVDTVRNQQGMIFKFIKIGKHFIHTLSDGELLYKLGLNPGKTVGRTLFDFLPVEYARNKIKYYEKSWAGESVSYEGNINGIDYLVQLRPVIIGGKVKEVIGSAVDITDKMLVERDLLKEKDFYCNILNTMSDGIFIYGANGEKIVLNENVYAFTRMNEVEFAKQTLINTTLQFIDEDGSTITKESNPVYYTQTTGKPLLNKIMGIIQENNETIWLSVNTRLLKNFKNQNESKVLLTMSDITIQKKHEIALKESYASRETIFNNLLIGILMVDKDWNIILMNERLRRMFHFDESMKNIIGSPTKEFYSSYYKNTLEEAEIVAEITKNNMSITEEIKVVDGRNVIRSYIPFFVGREFKGYLWTFEDITERKRLEQDRIRAKEEAVEASLAKSEFLSKMSHELRTPLNGVLGFSQLLEMDQFLNSQQQSFVQEILKGGRHLLDLINEVLDLARIESGELKVSLDYVEITDLIRECLNLLKPVANQKNIQITTEFSVKHNSYVFCDPLRLRQIVINLIDNAIKYNVENGKVTIVCEDHHGEVLVRIRDTGIGITKNEQQKIFAPFYRVNEMNIEGTGIGLSIVKQLIQLMNGQIGLNSGNEGGGSEFWFRLPSVHQTSDQYKSTENKQNEILECVKDSTILYIEDNLANVQLVKQILGNKHNLAIKTVMTGEEGIELIQKEDFDLILLDINLPGMSGFEVLNRLKSTNQTKNIPVIALSAYAMPDDIQRANKDGFSDYITKPIDIPSFLKIVSKYL
jgi:PAS domain S-box-containing protein